MTSETFNFNLALKGSVWRNEFRDLMRQHFPEGIHTGGESVFITANCHDDINWLHNMVWCGVVWCGVVWCGITCEEFVKCFHDVIWQYLSARADKICLYYLRQHRSPCCVLCHVQTIQFHLTFCSLLFSSVLFCSLLFSSLLFSSLLFSSLLFCSLLFSYLLITSKSAHQSSLKSLYLWSRETASEHLQDTLSSQLTTPR